MIKRARLVGGSVAAITGASVGLASGVILGYGPRWGFAVLAAVSAGLAGLLLGPTVARAREYGWLALAVGTYICGVLLWPVGALVSGDLRVLLPGMSPLQLNGGADLVAAYAFTPIGVLFAAPFAPGVLLGGAVAEDVIKRLAPLPEASDAEQARLSRVAGVTTGCLVVVAILGFAFLANLRIGV